MSLVGLLVGISLAQNLPLNATYVFEVVLTWVAVPLIAVASAFALMRALNHGWPKDFWRRLQIYKILLIALSFTTAYVTGANTLGLIVALGGFDLAAVLVAVAAVFVGCFFLAEGAIRRISQELYLMRYGNAAATLVTSTVLVEVATVFNIPLSITQTTSAAIFGTGLSYKTKLVSAKPFVKVVLGWVAAVLLSLGIGYLIG
jgi:PiT family inorganic phosphate transporter